MTKRVLGRTLSHLCFFLIYNPIWDAQVQDWLTARGLATAANHFSLFYTLLPDFLLNAVGCAILGYVGYRHWIQWALLFSATYFLSPYFLAEAMGMVEFGFSRWGKLYKVVILNAQVIPIAVFVGWVGASVRRRRIGRTPYPVCDHCGYNLTGNVTGICPECGTVVESRKGSLLGRLRRDKG